MGDLIDKFHSTGNAAMPLFGRVLAVRVAEVVISISWFCTQGRSMNSSLWTADRNSHFKIVAASLDVSNHSEIRAGLNYRFGGL